LCCKKKTINFAERRTKSEMSALTDAHRLLLQAIISRKVVNEKELITLFGQILDEYKIAKPRPLKGETKMC